MGPGIMELGQDLFKTGTSTLIIWREITAGEERLKLRCQKDVIGPSPVTGRQLGRQHINAIQIRTLLPIDFDINKPLVHQYGDFRIGIDFP